MKNIWKQILLFAAVSGGMLLTTGCLEDKMPALDGYPTLAPGLAISGIEGSVQTVKLKGTYDNAGLLTVAGETERTYAFNLPTPSSEDVTIFCEPIHTNIPADKVAISATEIKIPAGAVSGEITVGLLEGDFSFAKKAAETYELGVRIVRVAGANVEVSANNEAKVIIEKEAYVAGLSLNDKAGRTQTFERSYDNGDIINDEPISFEITARLSKPAESDVKVTFATTGIPEAFMKDVTITPAEVTIPAGSLEAAEVATWTVTDDFLLTNADPELYKVQVQAQFESEDETVMGVEEEDVINIDIVKVFDLVVLVPAAEADWIEYVRSLWSVTSSVQGGDGPASILDGKVNTSLDGRAYWLVIDMQQVQDVEGIIFQYYNTGTNSPDELSFSISDDNATWMSLGELSFDAKANRQYFKLLRTMSGRYLKFEMSTRNSWIYLAEVYVYHK